MFKALSLAAFAGLVSFGLPVLAEDTPTNSGTDIVNNITLGDDASSELLKNKPVTTPTLDYLRENNVLIPQKGEYNSADKTWAQAAPIVSPGSAYEIKALTDAEIAEYEAAETKDKMVFKYTTADTEGNLTNNYYKIYLHYTEDSSGAVDLGTSQNITWQEVDAAGDNTIEVKLPNNDIKYYQYTVNESNYSEVSKDITNDLGTITDPKGTDFNHTKIEGGAALNNPAGSSISIDNKLFQNNKTTVEIESTTTTGKYVDVLGGAVFNAGEITGINADFIDNRIDVNKKNVTWGTIYSEAHGGAIYNKGTIGDITGDFIGNTVFVAASSSYYGAVYGETYGGAICNYNYNGTAVIGDITGDFIGNSASGASRDEAYGGAIYNNCTIGNIKGDFINNSVSVSGTRGFRGGAIYNEGFIGATDDSGNIVGGIINSLFRGNYAQGSGSDVQGGAIWTNKNLNIIADNGNSEFTGNYVQDYGTQEKQFEAIYVADSAATLTLKSVNNGTITLNDYVNGVNGYNVNLTGDNTGVIKLYNDLKSANVIADTVQIDMSNGKIHNYTFNKLTSSEDANYILDINLADKTSDKITTATESSGRVTIDNLNFLGYINDYNNKEFVIRVLDTQTDALQLALSENLQNKNDNGDVKLGEIRNQIVDSIKNITNWNDIYNEYVELQDVYGKLTLAQTTTTNDSIGFIITGFGDMHTEGIGSLGDTLKLWNNLATTDVKEFNFDTANDTYTATDNLGVTAGNEVNINGVIAEDGTRSTIDLNNRKGFELTHRTGFNAQNVNIINAFGEKGSVIQIGNKNSVVNLTNVNLMNNVSSGGYGGAIYQKANYTPSTTEDALPVIQFSILNDDGTEYKSVYLCETPEQDIRDAISNGTITGYKIAGVESISKSELEQILAQELEKNPDFPVKTVDEYFDYAVSEVVQSGGLFALTTAPDSLFDELTTGVIISLTNSNIIGNHADADSPDGTAKGGAIYGQNAVVKISANNGETIHISGNYTKTGDDIDDNAIYLENGELIFDVTNGSTIKLDDNIKGESYETYITGDNQSSFVLNNNIHNSTVNLVETNLYLTKDNWLDGNNLNLHSGRMSMQNNEIGVSSLNNLTIAGDTNFVADVDLANGEMDRISAKSYGEHTGTLNVTGMNLLSDSAAKKTEIYFAEQGLKDHVTNGTAELPQSDFQTTAYTPIYKYEVSYDNREDGGYFVFNRGGNGGGNASGSYNPAVLASPVAAQSGALSVATQTFNYAFQNADNFMNIPYLERLSIRNANKYAITANGNATDVGNFSPLFTKSTTDSVWVKPYASFENVPLKNGPKVSNITYGTLFGYDTELIPMKHGWDRVWTGYIGYNGASQRYSGVDSTQNGGLLGGTLTLYKGNFFNATTVSAGASVGSNQTMYGHEDMTMLLAGVANKTGYNFEFKEGKLILQPSLMTSYTFVNTFDYTNAAGVRIKSDPLHSIQLSPNLKIIGNTKNGWQPYASVGMVWNILDETKVTAGETKLPEMSIKPYVQYGVGVQKRFKDKCMAFGQAMIQNGGRNGVSLTAGFRWSLGKEGKPIEKVTLPQKQAVSPNSAVTGTVASGVKPERKVLKQLTPAQRTALGAKPQNTTRTTTAAVLKQM